MPDDQTLATILAMCDLLGHTRVDVHDAVAAYKTALDEVLRYRRANGQTELGGVPREVEITK